MNMIIICLFFLLTRYVCPFVCGWWVTWRLVRCQAIRSVIILLHHQIVELDRTRTWEENHNWKLTFWCKAGVMVVMVVLGRGIASHHGVSYYLSTRICLLPLGVVGEGPMKSYSMNSNRSGKLKFLDRFLKCHVLYLKVKVIRWWCIQAWSKQWLEEGMKGGWRISNSHKHSSKMK